MGIILTHNNTLQHLRISNKQTEKEHKPIDMEFDYGMIRIAYYENQDNNDSDWATKLKCTKCGDEYDHIRNIKQRLKWHNDLNVH